MESTAHISEAEWQIMRILWSLERGDAHQISEIATDSTSWKPATVKTLLHRLVQKQIISNTTQGKKYIYEPLIDAQQASIEAADEMASHVCAQFMCTALATLIEQSDFTQADIDSLIQQLRNKKPVEYVACNCLPEKCRCEHAHGHDEGQSQRSQVTMHAFSTMSTVISDRILESARAELGESETLENCDMLGGGHRVKRHHAASTARQQTAASQATVAQTTASNGENGDEDGNE